MLTPDDLLQRRDELVAQHRERLADAEQARADAYAIEGAIQQVNWCLQHMTVDDFCQDNEQPERKDDDPCGQ